MLARREHSCWELRRKLLTKQDVAVQYVEQLLQDLVEQQLVSDARFTEAYIHARANRGFGPIRIREELKQKGIAALLIEQYLDENNEMWQKNLYHCWHKRFGHKLPKDFSDYAKQTRFLQYRGFASESIKILFNTFANN